MLSSRQFCCISIDCDSECGGVWQRGKTQNRSDFERIVKQTPENVSIITHGHDPTMLKPVFDPSTCIRYRPSVSCCSSDAPWMDVGVNGQPRLEQHGSNEDYPCMCLVHDRTDHLRIYRHHRGIEYVDHDQSKYGPHLRGNISCNQSDNVKTHVLCCAVATRHAVL